MLHAKYLVLTEIFGRMEYQRKMSMKLVSSILRVALVLVIVFVMILFSVIVVAAIEALWLMVVVVGLLC